jgi:predicted regulator of Ras-like GTPase activity (Roadblock/LC7/MglB family)
VNLDQAVTELVENCPGARSAAVVDPDGIPVVANPRSHSMEVLGAEFVSILREVDQAGREFRHGRLKQFTVFSDDVVVILTTMAAGYFLLLVLDHDALVGRGRFLSRLTGERLHSEFI